MGYGEHKNTSVPCYQCADRHAGCHSECSRYTEYKAKVDKIHETERICKSISYNKHFV